MRSQLLTNLQLDELLKRFRREDIVGPPYKVPELLKHSKVIETQEAEMDADGYTIPVNGYYIIGVNYKHSFYRKRFIYCHELAHTLLIDLETAGAIKKSSNQFDEEERLCNQIAVELLLPRNVFIRLAQKRKPSFSALHDLCKQFLVSFDVVRKRIIELDVWNVTMVSWQPMKAGNGNCPYSMKKIYGSGEGFMQSVRLSKQCIESINRTYTNDAHTVQPLGGSLVMESMRRKNMRGYYVLSLFAEQ